MSVRVMALIFAHKFPRLKTTVKVKGAEVEKNILQVSSKAVMLALGDHASDDGEGAYPSLTTLEIKTGLSRPALVTTLGALKNHGYLTYIGVSKLGTSKYKLNIDQLTAFTEVVNAVNQPSKRCLLGPVNGVNPIHPFNHPKPSLTTTTRAAPKPSPKNDPVITAYEQNIGAATSIILDAIYSERQRHKEQADADRWMIEAIGEAVNNNVRKWAYVEAILRGWHTNGYKVKPVKENKYPQRRDYNIPATPSPLPIPETGITPEQRAKTLAKMKELKPFGATV